MVSSATLYFQNPSTSTTPCASSIPAPAGTSALVTIPSGTVMLNQQFDIATTSNILIDFDGNQSIVATGNGGYMMTPVISIASVQ